MITMNHKGKPLLTLEELKNGCTYIDPNDHLFYAKGSENMVHSLISLPDFTCHPVSVKYKANPRFTEVDITITID